MGDKAHNSNPPKSINIDETGISMSWRTATGVIGAFVAGAVIWTVFTASLVRKDELVAHNASQFAHPVTIDGQPRTLRDQALQVQSLIVEVRQLSATIATQAEATEDVVRAFNEDRAERVATSVAEKIKDGQRSREVWIDVRQQALQNLRTGAPIRQGIE